MLDLTAEIIPLASFVAGVSGSLHCIGMCGGLVTASCDGGKDVLKYQIGRLLGYLILGSIAFALGYVLRGVISFHWGPLISGIFLGCLFIYWGFQNFQGKKAEIPLPNFFRKSYQFLFRNYASKAGSSRSFFVGLISIMLPCGLIYGLLISAVAIGDFANGLMSLFLFWLGTLPAMMGAPQLIRKILNPLRTKLPKAYAIVFILVGLMTIAGRVSEFHWEAKANSLDQKVIHHCH